MPSTKSPSKRITFAQLREALKSLGFEDKLTPDFAAFRELEHDALIVLPAMRPDQFVDDAHMIAVRNTVTGRGVASLRQLQARLVGRGETGSPVVISVVKPPRGKGPVQNGVRLAEKKAASARVGSRSKAPASRHQPG